VNDNAPAFQQTEYMVNISEAAPVGTSILTLSATDADTGSNAHVLFHVEPHPSVPDDASLFYIDAERGLLLVRQGLDREQAAQLKFVVVASNAGIPSLSSSVVVTVNVADVNDNSPTFDQTAYEASISDRAARGQFVIAVHASDDDVSDRRRLTYAVVDGNVRQAFAVDSETGVMRTANVGRRLAANVQGAYMLNVSASDGVFTAFTRVKIVVERSNSFTPVFSQSVFDADVTEKQPAGVSVTTVSATDGDDGVYGDVTYSIIGEDADELFAIDSQTGEVASVFVFIVLLSHHTVVWVVLSLLCVIYFVCFLFVSLYGYRFLSGGKR